MSEPLAESAPRLTPKSGARRRSLLTFAATAAAAAVVRTSTVSAGKDAKKAKKRSRKKCRRQIAQCRSVITDFCTKGAVECPDDKLEAALACCSPLSTCKASRSLDCFFAT
jgi:hypothetical protein